MLHALALILGGFASAVVLAGALALGGPPAAPAPPANMPAGGPGGDVAAAPQVQVDTVYLAPPPPPKTITVHKTVTASRGEHEGDEGGADD